MKKLYFILSLTLLAGCAQDMGHYVGLPAKSPCKVVIIAPNRYDIEPSIYKRLVNWAQNELPTLQYIVLEKVTEETPKPCGEVVLHYNAQLIPPIDEPTLLSPVDNNKICVSTPNTAALYRYRLTLEIQDPKTQQSFFSVSTEMESRETNIDKVLSSMQSALYAKFLLVQGPESQVETKATNNILPA